jgi:hypothetical protein
MYLHGIERGHVIRRRDALALALIGAMAATAIWALFFSGAAIALLVPCLSILVAAVALLYLNGPAAYVRVSETHVVVANPIFRYVVPRSLVDGVQGRIKLNIQLRVNGHPPIPVSALMPGLAGRHSMSTASFERRLGSLVALLNETPAIPADGTVQRRYRFVHILLMAGSTAVVAASLVYASHHR